VGFVTPCTGNRRALRSEYMQGSRSRRNCIERSEEMRVQEVYTQEQVGETGHGLGNTLHQKQRALESTQLKARNLGDAASKGVKKNAGKGGL
jgi:hypothetical protein